MGQATVEDCHSRAQRTRAVKEETHIHRHSTKAAGGANEGFWGCEEEGCDEVPRVLTISRSRDAVDSPSDRTRPFR